MFRIQSMTMKLITFTGLCTQSSDLSQSVQLEMIMTMITHSEFNMSSLWFNNMSTLLARIQNIRVHQHVKFRPNGQNIWLAVQHVWSCQETSQRRTLLCAFASSRPFT